MSRGPERKEERAEREGHLQQAERKRKEGGREGRKLTRLTAQLSLSLPLLSCPVRKATPGSPESYPLEPLEIF